MDLRTTVLWAGRAGTIALGGFVFFCTFACSAGPSYRVVKKTQYDGVLALYRPNDQEARAEIDRVMRDHCRGEYEVLEEGEVVIGKVETTTVDQNQTTQHGRTFFGNPAANTRTTGSQTTTAQDKTEVQLKYRCKAGGAPAAAPTAAPATTTPGAAPVQVQAAPRAEEVHVLRVQYY